jgi:SAM-dependent methyltransferase
VTQNANAVKLPPPADASPMPVPPFELANRVGALPLDTWEQTFEAIGAGIRRDVDRLLPADWVWEGKRVLDFGSGAGRALRHFHDLVPHNEFWGCDIHEESIDWLNENLAPMRGVVCGHEPGVPLANGSVDLIWASSVFTHLTDHWSGWLLELHRLLGEGGILIATFLGDAMAQPVFGEEWDDDRIGMNVSAYNESFDVGGPNVLMSPWWIQARWGRAFDILRIEPSGFTGVAGSGQGIIVARKRLVPVTTAELERPEHGEPREWTAMVHQRTQLYREMLRWRGRARHLEVALDVASRGTAPAAPAEIPEDVQTVLDLAPQVIAENHQLAEQVIELAREAAELEREIERLKAQVPAAS